jgi:hypothetical protein
MLAFAACSDASRDDTQLAAAGSAPGIPPAPEQPAPEQPAPEDPSTTPPAPASEPAFASAPVLHGPVDLDDLELGRQVLALLGRDGAKGEGRCSGCHSITRPTLSLWGHSTRGFSTACLSDTALDSQERVDDMYHCLLEHAAQRKIGSKAELNKAFISPSSVGIYAAASHLPWFSFLIEHASEVGEGAKDVHARFVQQVGMPRGSGERLTQAEFALVAEWFERDLPGMLELVPEDPGAPCVPGLAPELALDLDELARVGWAAKNRETPLLMFGCGPGEAGAACLTDLPSAADSPAGAGWADAVPGSTIRLLYDNSDNPLTVYWSRSSADGRYVASGVGFDGKSSGEKDDGLTGQFIDLDGARRMRAAYSFDPTFFPDNTGFLVQGSYSSGGNSEEFDANSGTLVCNQSVLGGRFDTITGETEGCSLLGDEIGLYQQLATSLDGNDTWAVHGQFESDEPGDGTTRIDRNPFAPFSADSELGFTPVIDLGGGGFEHGASVYVATPFQGDPALSPSGRLLVTRTKGAEHFTKDAGLGPLVTADQSGYTFHRVRTARNGGTWSVSLERAGQVCLTGGKATFSYDERWLVLHHYITPDDAVELGHESAQAASFTEYARLGGANLHLVDLKSGQVTRITHMGPGQYALFPHFRSDGWIYFVVRSSDGTERFFASDAALRIEAL